MSDQISTITRHQYDPGAHLGELFGCDFSDAGGGSSNDDCLALHEHTPSPCLSLAELAL
jgi:hypothetical protein